LKECADVSDAPEQPEMPLGFSLSQIAEAIHHNYAEMMAGIPTLSEAVETIHRGFDIVGPAEAGI
jgi:putative N-acetylmannosamine-6-phosphate epimerase